MQILDVTIERILPGGLGLAHAEGQTVFVSLAAPDDVLRVRIDRIKGKIAFASIIEVLKPSPQRVEPPCPYFGLCGGCDFQQLSYQAQLDAKTEIIRDCLRRIAIIENPPEIVMHGAPNQWRYRARANWQLDAIERKIGYFEAGSHRVCDVEVCAVLQPDLEEALEDIRKQLREGSLPEIPRDIRAAAGNEGVSLAPSLGKYRTSDVSMTVGEESYWFNADSFFQANPDLLKPLIDTALSGATGKLAVELYCGAGLFTTPLARSFERVIGVEVNNRATRFAARNIEYAGLENAEIVTADVGRWISEHSHSFAATDFLLLDPPRTGAENVVIKGIVDLKPGRIS
ncbi:MAG TPA: TRAM domain-containing protein, partial [Pyrinomonadaceae bacterium]|nr:TRAM domain-containing protein [Pyrinomonadaceae bacterium]